MTLDVLRGFLQKLTYHELKQLAKRLNIGNVNSISKTELVDNIVKINNPNKVLQSLGLETSKVKESENEALQIARKSLRAQKWKLIIALIMLLIAVFTAFHNKTKMLGGQSKTSSSIEYSELEDDWKETRLQLDHVLSDYRSSFISLTSPKRAEMNKTGLDLEKDFTKLVDRINSKQERFSRNLKPVIGNEMQIIYNMLAYSYVDSVDAVAMIYKSLDYAKWSMFFVNDYEKQYKEGNIDEDVRMYLKEQFVKDDILLEKILAQSLLFKKTSDKTLLKDINNTYNLISDDFKTLYNLIKHYPILNELIH